jgi:spore photoproduct lyase
MKKINGQKTTNFSHIYVEDRAEGYPDTDRILEKFQKARIIRIDDYKSVFNRRGQHFQTQKDSMKLILAVKKDQFVYPGSPFAPNFGQPNFFYNTLMLNCVFNCDYCYLQGRYTSANIVIFVNQESFFAAAAKVIAEKGSIYLCISYDTDLLAFEHVIPNCGRWIDWAENKAGALIEIRTKSSNFAAISGISPPRNTILAWTLSPTEIAIKYESKTPSLKARLEAIKIAIASGWKVRICVDPILRVNNWRKLYAEMIEEIRDAIDMRKIYDFSLGVFRMNWEYLQRIHKERCDSDILYYPFTVENQVCSYKGEAVNEMTNFVRKCILAKMPDTTVF